MIFCRARLIQTSWHILLDSLKSISRIDFSWSFREPVFRTRTRMSSGAIGGIIIALAFSTVWNLLPSWQAAEEGSHTGGIQVSSPVSDSVITSIDCNCHCVDRSVHDSICAFVGGALSACLVYALVRICCWHRQQTDTYQVPEELPQSRRPSLRLALLPEAPAQRRTVVTPSTRR